MKVAWDKRVNPIPIDPPLTTATIGLMLEAIAISILTITTLAPF